MTPLPNHLRLDEPVIYRIWVQGRLDPSWNPDNPDMELSVRKTKDGMTITSITCPVVDQASLHGVLNKVRDYGLVLLALYPVEMPVQEFIP